MTLSTVPFALATFYEVRRVLRSGPSPQDWQTAQEEARQVYLAPKTGSIDGGMLIWYAVNIWIPEAMSSECTCTKITLIDRSIELTQIELTQSRLQQCLCAHFMN